MYNTDMPKRAELPTSAQLKRSTFIASIVALVLLITVVLPSEYAIDPTRIGRLLGLTEMGQIKTQLAAEAEADAAVDAAGGASPADSQQILARLDRIETLLASGATPARAASAAPAPTAAPPAPAQVAPTPQPQAQPQKVATKPSGRSDEMSFELTPGQGVEVKLVMKEGARANFNWASKGGPVNFDTHGDAKGKSISYEKGRGVDADEGTLEAAFDGNHGWFWRNRNKESVTVTLRTNGDYVEIRRMN